VLDQPHTEIPRPAAFVIVPDDIVVGGIGVGAEIPLDEVSRFVGGEAEQDMEFVDIARVKADRMADFGGRIAVLEEIVGHLRGTGLFAGSLEAEDEEIHDETIVLENERGKLQSADETVRVRVGHVLVGQHSVVLSRDIVGQVAVQDESEETLQEGGIHLLVDLRELRLHQDDTFALGCLLDAVQVVDSLTPLVHQERRRFGVGRFDPGREEAAFVRLEEEILVEISVRDLLHRFDIVTRDELVVGVEELDTGFLEGSLSEQ